MSLSKNSVAVITGAASGIGRALAARFAGEKIAGIAICDVNEQGLSETFEIVEKLGAKVSKHLVDTSKLEQIERLKTEVLAAHNRATHLINNAGVGLMGTFEQISLEDFEWLMSINFWGVIYGCKVFLPVLKQQDQRISLMFPAFSDSSRRPNRRLTARRNSPCAVLPNPCATNSKTRASAFRRFIRAASKPTSPAIRASAKKRPKITKRKV